VTMVRSRRLRILCAVTLVPAAWLGSWALHSPRTSFAKEGEPGSAAYSLLVPAPYNTGELIRLDPTTLQTMAPQTFMHLTPGWNRAVEPTLIASGDGSTLATVTIRHPFEANPPARDVTIHVYNRAGSPVAIFHPAVRIAPFGFQLSPDGGLIYVAGMDAAGNFTEWFELNARSGRVFLKLPASVLGSCCAPSLVDAAHGQMYGSRIIAPQSSGYGSLQLSAYDLASGKMTRSVDLKDVLTGYWNLDSSNANPETGGFSPGIALSPDGRSLAVLGANDDVLRLIDTSTFAVTQSHLLVNGSTSSNFLGTIAGWLGLAPTIALAKQIQGTFLSMRYSPDGNLLYVTGTKASIDSGGGVVWTGLGLRVVEAATGRVIATTLENQSVDWIGSSPDGNAIYALSTPVNDNSSNPMKTLSRYDLTTRTLTAQRAFDWPQILVVPGS
jgi:WD40 repeat protein